MIRMVQQYEFGPVVPEGWMTSTAKVRADMTPHLRGAIMRRDRGLCRYCACKPVRIEIDHVKPVCRGGLSTMANCVTACRPCNQRKGWSLGWMPIPLDEMPWAVQKREKKAVQSQRRKKSKKMSAEKLARREQMFIDNRIDDPVRRAMVSSV